jgi:hypothetical protein
VGLSLDSSPIGSSRFDITVWTPLLLHQEPLWLLGYQPDVGRAVAENKMIPVSACLLFVFYATLVDKPPVRVVFISHDVVMKKGFCPAAQRLLFLSLNNKLHPSDAC